MSAAAIVSWDELSSDGDEIVYLESCLTSPVTLSDADDGDYILVPHLRTPPQQVVPAPRAVVEREETNDVELLTAMAELTLAPAPRASRAKPSPKAKVSLPMTPKRRRRRNNKTVATPTTTTTTITSASKQRSPTPAAPDSAYPSPPVSPSPQSRRARKRAAAKATAKLSTGLGERTVVDDVSELGDVSSAETPAYAAARSYIASHLANPPATLTSGMLLPLLQALIVELGLSEQTPSSVRAAKAILKTRAFINVREYLAAREVGQEALRRAMHPSRTSLVRSLRKGAAARAPRDWVKSTGLGVLLVDLHL